MSVEKLSKSLKNKVILFQRGIRWLLQCLVKKSNEELNLNKSETYCTRRDMLTVQTTDASFHLILKKEKEIEIHTEGVALLKKNKKQRKHLAVILPLHYFLQLFHCST